MSNKISWHQTPKGKRYYKRYRQSEQFRIAKMRYNRSPKGRAAQRRYNQSIEHKLAAQRWAQSDHGRKTLRAHKHRLRLEVLTHYCGGSPHCMCKGCPVTILAILDLHHIDNNGAAHRELIGGSGNLLNWLRNNGYPKGYKVLCANCHRSRHAKAPCFHQ